MFDSLYVKCPECGKELEFQSKSGICLLDSYRKNNLPPEVAIGLDGDVAKCQFCNKNIKIICNIPKKVKIKLVKTKQRADYNGNYK